MTALTHPILAFSVLGALASTGCSTKPAPVAACEAVLMPTLKSPSTYKLADFTLGPASKGGTQDVFLSYDAVNSFNAPIRSRFWCSYNSVTERAEKHDDSSALPDDMSLPPGDTGTPTLEPSPPVTAPVPAHVGEVPVCDRPDSEEKFALMNELGTDCTGE